MYVSSSYIVDIYIYIHNSINHIKASNRIEWKAKESIEYTMIVHSNKGTKERKKGYSHKRRESPGIVSTIHLH